MTLATGSACPSNLSLPRFEGGLMLQGSTQNQFFVANSGEELVNLATKERAKSHSTS